MKFAIYPPADTYEFRLETSDDELDLVVFLPDPVTDELKKYYICSIGRTGCLFLYDIGYYDAMIDAGFQCDKHGVIKHIRYLEE